ncbi:MAG: hypothetical protein ACUVTD_09005 [Nitrososphaerales archaeon]
MRTLRVDEPIKSSIRVLGGVLMSVKPWGGLWRVKVLKERVG